jgi:opacity protein-like surface antigen
MKRILAALALVGLISAPAAAADMALKARPPSLLSPEPTYNWTGFYVGAHVGYYWGATENDTVFLPNASASGAFGGFQGGYRYQMANNVVVGVQVSSPVFASDQTKIILGTFVDTVRDKGAVLGQLQLGYALGRWMPFVTAGVGFLKTEAVETNGGVTSLTVHNTHTVGTVGFGVNYGITDHVTTGLRWNHAWTSKETYNCGPALCNLVGNFSGWADAVVGVLEYKF